MCPQLLHQCPLSPCDSSLIGSENKSPGPFLRATEHTLLSVIMPTRITGRCVPLFLDQCWNFYHWIPRMDVNMICMEFVFMSTMRWLNRTKRTPCPSFRCDGISEIRQPVSKSLLGRPLCSAEPPAPASSLGFFTFSLSLPRAGVRSGGERGCAAPAWSAPEGTDGRSVCFTRVASSMQTFILNKAQLLT